MNNIPDAINLNVNRKFDLVKCLSDTLISTVDIQRSFKMDLMQNAKIQSEIIVV